jgi:Fic family protein
MSLQLVEAGRLQYPLLNLAEWLEPRKAEYQDNLFHLSLDGDFNHWIAFMAKCMEEQARVAVSRIDALLSERERILQIVRKAVSRGGTSFKVADELISFPIIDVPWVADRHGITYQSANSAVNVLVGLGVLTETRRSGRTRKIFYSREVLRHLQ